MKQIPVKGATAQVVTKTTPIAVNGESKNKSTTKTTVQNTGVVILNEESTKLIKDEQKRQEPSVLTRYIHFIFGKKEDRKASGDGYTPLSR